MRNMVDQSDATQLGCAFVSTETPRLSTRDNCAEQGHVARKRLFLDRSTRTIFLDRFDRILRPSFAAIAFGPEDQFVVIFELGDIFPSLVLFDHELVCHHSISH